MENTIQNKTKFFQHNLHKPFVYINVFGDKHSFTPNGIVGDFLYVDAKPYAVDGSYMEVIPLTSITDEDAIEIANIVAPMMFMTSSGKPIVDRSEKDWLTVRKKYSLISVDIDYSGFTTRYHEEDEYQMNPNQTHALDVLRSKNYGMPFFDLTIEELITRGWVNFK